MSLIAVGDFVFEAGETSYEELRFNAQARWVAQERIRAPLAHQFLGPGEQIVEMDGTLYPDSGVTSGPEMIQSLLRAGLNGQTFMVVGGDGSVFGRYTLQGITQVRTYLNEDGTGRKHHFHITLKEYGGDRGQFGGLGLF